MEQGSYAFHVNESLDRTQEINPDEATRAKRMPARTDFRTGVAAVPESAPHETTLHMSTELPTGQIVTSGQLKRPRPPLRLRVRTLRKGGRWSMLGAAVLLVSWTLWAAQSLRDSLTNEALILVIILAVGAGLFGVSRLVGGIVLERWLKRTRRSARLSHLAIGLFLAAAGVSLLAQVEWLVNVWASVRGAG